MAQEKPPVTGGEGGVQGPPTVDLSKAALTGDGTASKPLPTTGVIGLAAKDRQALQDQ